MSSPASARSWRADRRSWHASRDRGTLLQHGIVAHYRWIAIGLVSRHDHRRSTRQSADDRGAAADRPQPRVRRALRHPRRRGGILLAHAECAALHHGRPEHGSHSWRADLHRQPDGRGKVTGTSSAASDSRTKGKISSASRSSRSAIATHGDLDSCILKTFTCFPSWSRWR